MKLCIPHYRSSIDTFRFVLMICVCLNLFGVPAIHSDLPQIFLNFAPCACFIISGYLVLRGGERQERHLLKAIKKSGITFAILFVIYLGLNFWLEREYTLAHLVSKRFWFDFVVFNNWNMPIGRPIWFVQALFYAYVILYFVYKWNLLDYDWIIAAVCLLITMLTGELSGLINFNFLGESFIPGNFFTRALPYILIGRILRRKEESLIVIRYNWWWILASGIALMVAETIILQKCNAFTYFGHLIGMAVVATVLCVLVITGIDDMDQAFAVLSFRRDAWQIMYYFCSPVYYLLARLTASIDPNFFGQISSYMGVVVVMVCISLALIYEVLMFFLWPSHTETEVEKDLIVNE